MITTMHQQRQITGWQARMLAHLERDGDTSDFELEICYLYFVHFREVCCASDIRRYLLTEPGREDVPSQQTIYRAVRKLLQVAVTFRV
jgi:hypothetical protein